MSDAQGQKNTREPGSRPAQAGNAAASATASSAQRGAESMKQNAQTTSDALRQGGEAAAEAARRAGEAGAETWRRSAGAMAESQRRMAQDAAEGFQGATRAVTETTRSTAEDVSALLTLPKAADRGLQEWHHGVAQLIEGVLQTNLRATQELFRLTSPAPYVELQQRYVREYVSAMLEGSAAVVRGLRQTAEQTLPPLEQHLRQRSAQSDARHKAAAE